MPVFLVFGYFWQLDICFWTDSGQKSHKFNEKIIGINKFDD